MSLNFAPKKANIRRREDALAGAGSVRRQIEDALAYRVPGALSPRQRIVVPRVATGVPEIDALLGGGLPVGAITEAVGSSCSGRTSFALAFIAELTCAGQMTAWVDVADALDPESAAAAGVDLSRQLWIRCGSDGKQPVGDAATTSDVAGQTLLQHGQRCRPQKSDAAEAHYPVPITRDDANPAEARRERKNIGTPEMPNRPLEPKADGAFGRRAFERKEQTPTNRQPSRHPTVIVPCCIETPTIRHQARQANSAFTPALDKKAAPKRPGFQSATWTALDQAVRAADLLLSAGGFAALVLDLGSTPPEFASRIPMATWFRFRAAAERSRTTILLLTQHPCARSSAGLVLRLRASSVTTAGEPFTGRNYEVNVSRQRFEAVEEQSHEANKVISMRKPPQSERCTTWSRQAAWAPFVNERTLFASTGKR